MVSESHKRARDRWDADHMVTLGVKMRRTEAEALAILAERNGETRHAVLLRAAREYIAEHEGRDVPGVDSPQRGAKAGAKHHRKK